MAWCVHHHSIGSLTQFHLQRVVSDSAGGYFMCGYTDSPDLPALSTAFSASSRMVFIARFDAARALVYSTYYGSTRDTTLSVRSDTCMQPLSNSFQSCTFSVTSSELFFTGTVSITVSDLPVLNAYQGVFGGGPFDAFVAKVSSAGVLTASTYFGGTGADASSVRSMCLCRMTHSHAVNRSDRVLRTRDWRDPEHGPQCDCWRLQLCSKWRL